MVRKAKLVVLRAESWNVGYALGLCEGIGLRVGEGGLLEPLNLSESVLLLGFEVIGCNIDYLRDSTSSMSRV